MLQFFQQNWSATFVIWIVLAALVVYFNYCASIVSGSHEDSQRDAGQ